MRHKVPFRFFEVAAAEEGITWSRSSYENGRWKEFGVYEEMLQISQHSYLVPDRLLFFGALKSDVPELHRICWSPDLEALKLWKGRSGILLSQSNSYRQREA